MTDVLKKKFNRWTVLKLDRSQNHKTYYLCRCECGTKKSIRKDQLTRGISKSCGCWKAEVSAAQVKRLFTTHGQANRTRTYSIWKGMRKRCLNPNEKRYVRYGGRGISICDRWQKYENFLSDMGEAPAGHSLDRIDNDGDYEPSNCRWASKKTQANNTSANIPLTFCGETLTIHQWSDRLGIPYHMLWQRLYRLNWPIEKAFTTPRLENQYSSLVVP